MEGGGSGAEMGGVGSGGRQAAREVIVVNIGVVMVTQI